MALPTSRSNPCRVAHAFHSEDSALGAPDGRGGGPPLVAGVKLPPPNEVAAASKSSDVKGSAPGADDGGAARGIMPGMRFAGADCTEGRAGGGIELAASGSGRND